MLHSCCHSSHLFKGLSSVTMSASTTVNPDLAKARAQATFDPLHLTHFLCDGPEKTKRKRYLQNLAAKDYKEQGFRSSAHLTREEQYDEALKKSCFAIKRTHELGIASSDPEQFIYREVLFQGSANPVGLHTGMFINTLENQCTEEQKKKWLPLANNMQIIGTYAQTELGHGSFLRGLETTATYDPKREEFTINSPTITSSKWWPGGLGKTSNYCVVMAKLNLMGKNVGMQPFLVPIRDLKTHEPLPGVSVGDIGPKFGYWGMDNGFLRLSNVKVPRENMLMKHSQVLPDGTFVRPKNDRLVYGSMTVVRVLIVSGTGRALSKAVTIATRYSAVRRQSEINAGAGEVAVLDFQTQQHKLIPLIATSYALMCVSREMFAAFSRVQAQIHQGSTEELPILHALSSGLKSFCSWEMMAGMEQCRLSCGGHGYMAASGIPKIYANEAPAATYEGENTVLCLQTARFLMKCYAGMIQGEKLPEMVSFLKTAGQGHSPLTDKLELDHLIAAYEHRAANKIAEAADRVRRQQKRGLKPAEANNASAQLLVEASLAFAHAYVVRAFIQRVENAKTTPELKTVMRQLCRLFACDGINRFSGHFTRGGYMSDYQIDIVKSATFDLLAALKPNAVALVDAFDYPDIVLDSALGRYDGNVYEALYEYARASTLNDSEVHPGYHKYQRPLMDYMKAQAKL